LAIIAEPLERLIEVALAERHTPQDTHPILSIVVAPGRRGCNHFDPYRLRIAWRDTTVPSTSLRRLYDHMGAVQRREREATIAEWNAASWTQVYGRAGAVLAGI
jgi:hypothetical protein